MAKRPRLLPCLLCLLFISLVVTFWLSTAGETVHLEGGFLQIPCEPDSSFQDLSFPFPKVIHMAFEYDGKKNASSFAKLEDWVAKNPGFQYRHYNLAEIEEFVHKHSPDLVKTFSKLPKISKIDFWRYLVMYIEGGLYIDSDVVCLKPIEEWLTRFRGPLGIVVGLESVVSSPKKAKSLGYLHRAQICNWMLLSVPGHPLWLKILQAIKPPTKTFTNPRLNLAQIIDIVGNTGPGRLTEMVVSHFSNWGITESFEFRSGAQICDIGILPHGAVGKGFAEDIDIIKETSFIDHGFEGSWKHRP